MTIQELLKKSGGVIEFEVDPFNFGDEGRQPVRLILQPNEGVLVLFEDNYGHWQQYCDADPMDDRLVASIFNAILAAHSRESGFDEMLAALEAVADYTAQGGNPCLYRIARAAIKKAKGEG